MGDTNGDTPTLYTTDDTGNYVEYTPSEPPAFRETLPEDIRENEHLSEIEDSSQLARYYVNLKKDYLAPPETADGYEPEMPEGFQATEAEIKAFKEAAFEEGLNQKQFQRIVDFSAQTQKQVQETLAKNINDNHDKAVEELKTEWGADYDKKVELAKMVLNHESLADEGFKQFLEDTRLGDNPQVVKYFAKLSDLISEDGFIKPGKGDSGPQPQRTEDGRPMLSFPSMQEK